jgi:hypothetical protein
MSAPYAFAVEGLDTLKNIENLPQQVITAARQAINKTLDHARTESARRIALQVNFSAQYLSPGEGRLAVARRATDAKLEGAIVGRHRPTSLARFATSSAPNKHSGVTVVVKPGGARFMRRAFLIRLRSGATLTDTKFNLGLAIRLKPGESITNKREMVKLSGNLYLLYGPSVDQVFRTVREDIGPDALNILESEFLRLMDLGNAKH